MGAWRHSVIAAIFAAGLPHHALAATNWPTHLVPQATTSSNPARLPGNLSFAPVSADAASEATAFAGRWEGWLCTNAATDVKVAVTSVTAGSATLVYAAASSARESRYWRITAKLVDGELIGDYGSSSQIILARRADGHLNIRTQDTKNPKSWCVGVLTNADRATGPKLFAPMEPEVHRIPVGTDQVGDSVQLYTTVVRPKTDQPMPLAVVNHGAPGPDDPYWTRSVTQWLVSRGYVVALPIRRGYPPSGGGRRADDYGMGCNQDFYNGGLAAANDVLSTLEYMHKQPYVAARDNILIGQSAGGWAVIASSTRPLPGVAAIVNFAGGWRVNRTPCAEHRLITTARRYGAESKIPMLWIYSQNDQSFSSSYAPSLHAAYTEAGGRAELLLMPPFREDGHSLFIAGLSLWKEHVESFLDKTLLAAKREVESAGR